jgi:hypothetical protein
MMSIIKGKKGPIFVLYIRNDGLLSDIQSIRNSPSISYSFQTDNGLLTDKQGT